MENFTWKKEPRFLFTYAEERGSLMGKNEVSGITRVAYFGEADHVAYFSFDHLIKFLER